MWTLVVFNALFIVALPAFWIMAGRNKFMLEKHTGMRTEVRREGLSRAVKASIPAWLMLVLVEADQVIHMFPASRDFRMFWLGFFSASWLFITSFIIVSGIPLLRQIREKRRQRLEEKLGAMR